MVVPKQLVVKLIGPNHGAKLLAPQESAIHTAYEVFGAKPLIVYEVPFTVAWFGMIPVPGLKPAGPQATTEPGVAATPCTQATTALVAAAEAEPLRAGKQAGCASYVKSSRPNEANVLVVRIAKCLNPAGTTGNGTVYSSQVEVRANVSNATNELGFPGVATKPTIMEVVDHVDILLARNRTCAIPLSKSVNIGEISSEPAVPPVLNWT